jgi:prevent-host-death family protein
MRTMTSVEAQSRFGEMLDAARREPVTITRRGRPVAVVMSPEDIQELSANRALDALSRYRKAVEGDKRESVTEDEIKKIVDAVK